jgi:tetratricopeptide (TPR) repeat protein
MKKTIVIIGIFLIATACDNDLDDQAQIMANDEELVLNNNLNQEVEFENIIDEKEEAFETTYSLFQPHLLYQELPLFGGAKNAGCELLETSEAVCPGEHIFPIGWSSDGKFAYIKLTTSEDGLAYRVIENIIQDLVTDEIIWSSSDCYGEMPNCTNFLSLDSEGDYENFEQKLAEFKISRSSEFELLTFPLAINNNSLGYELSLEESEGEIDGLDGLIESSQVMVKYLDGRFKVIYAESYPDGSRPYYIYVPGFIKSPYEERIVVFVAEEYLGWEGPPDPVNIDVIGVSLNDGFVSVSPIKSYLLNYFQKSKEINNDFRKLDSSLFSLNNSNGELVIKIKWLPDYHLDNVDQLRVCDFYESINSNCLNIGDQLITCSRDQFEGNSGCLPRADEVFWRDLEKDLISNFPSVSSLSVYYGNEPYYKDRQYQQEYAIIALSADGRYAELVLDQIGPGPDSVCYFWDLYQGKCLFEITYDFTENNNVSKISKKHAEIRSKYDLKTDFQESGGFFTESYLVNEEIEVIPREYLPADLDPENPDAEFFKSTELLLLHKPTGLKIQIITKNNNYEGLYGHNQMQGLLMLTWWNWEAEKIFEVTPVSKSLFDHKLSRLYNNVAMHYYDQQDYDSAISYFQKALEIDPSYAQAYFNQACTYALLGEQDKGVKALNKAIKLESGKFIEKAKNDNDLDSIRHLLSLP